MVCVLFLDFQFKDSVLSLYLYLLKFYEAYV